MDKLNRLYLKTFSDGRSYLQNFNASIQKIVGPVELLTIRTQPVRRQNTTIQISVIFLSSKPVLKFRASYEKFFAIKFDYLHMANQKNERLIPVKSD